MRDLINIFEDKKELKLKKLPYGMTSLAPVMSRHTLEIHYGKLAKGYVDRYNNGNGSASFNEAGAYLHNLFFQQLRSPKNANTPHGVSLSIINQQFGSFKDFKDEFEERASKLQGSMWLYMSKNGSIKSIKDHAKRSDIALLVDFWEHAYINDYGSDKKKYLKNFWKIVNWSEINNRIAGSSKS